MQVSTNTTSSTPGESKKWGLGWPNGDSSYLSNFVRPKVCYPYLSPEAWCNQIDDFKSLVLEGYAKKVLGMTEPNEPSQSYMSPQDGIALWQHHIDPLKYRRYYLISSACTNDQVGLGWMKSSIEECTDCTIDAIAFHLYGTDSKALVDRATTLHDAYNKPIWITEFADQNFSGSVDQAADIYTFQSVVVEFVDNTPWIEAVFPFGVMHDLQGVNEGNCLLTEDGWPMLTCV